MANFESGTINHSDTSPEYKFYLKNCRWGKLADILPANLSNLKS